MTLHAPRKLQFVNLQPFQRWCSLSWTIRTLVNLCKLGPDTAKIRWRILCWEICQMDSIQLSIEVTTTILIPFFILFSCASVFLFIIVNALLIYVLLILSKIMVLISSLSSYFLFSLLEPLSTVYWVTHICIYKNKTSSMFIQFLKKYILSFVDIWGKWLPGPFYNKNAHTKKPFSTCKDFWIMFSIYHSPLTALLQVTMFVLLLLLYFVLIHFPRSL